MLLKNGIFDRRHVFAGRGKFLGEKKRGGDPDFFKV